MKNILSRTISTHSNRSRQIWTGKGTNVTIMQTTLLARRLTTAEILYHMPDYPGLLQSFVWQHMDVAPDYPRLHKFLEFWQDNIEGRLHSVTVAADALNRPCKIHRPCEIHHAKAEFRLH